MKWTRIAAAMVATLSLTSAAHAGLLDLFKKSGSSKCCDYAPSCQPQCCAPTITKPCCPTVHTYQRKVSKLKPPCCDTCAAPGGCCPTGRGKCAAPCGPVGGKCAAPCGPVARGKCCPPKGRCAAPCGPVAKDCCPQKGRCCAPVAKDRCPLKGRCAAPCGPVAKGCCPQPRRGKCCAPVAKGCCPKGKGCCPRGDGCCDRGCRDDRCCDADPCEIAKLIYASQTSCYAKDRKKAIKCLGKFDCVCNPEIMTAFIYALNDADEEVREEAAEEIRDQLKDNPCCCNQKVIAALTAALGDCDKDVRKDAEKALRCCGYEVVDGCCEGVCCDPCQRRAGGCVNGGCVNGGGYVPGVPGGPVAPGQPPTPADGKGKDMKKKDAPPLPGAAFHRNVPVRRFAPRKKKSRLSNLFGLIN